MSGIESSEQVDAISAALVTVRPLLPVIPRSHTGKIQTKSGAEYSYNYADLADTRATCDPILAEHGLSVIQFPAFDGTNDLLVTRVIHSSGQWLQASMRLFLAQQTPQGMGSAISYARRYSYTAALGVVTDDDDDGASANIRKRQGPKQQATPRSTGSCAACGGTGEKTLASGRTIPCPACSDGKEATKPSAEDDGAGGASAAPPDPAASAPSSKTDYDRRRAAANAALVEVGIRETATRHQAVREATGGATESTAELTEDQMHQVRDYCQRIKAERAGPEQP